MINLCTVKNRKILCTACYKILINSTSSDISVQRIVNLGWISNLWGTECWTVLLMEISRENYMAKTKPVAKTKQ
jgi:hypothetical protein